MDAIDTTRHTDPRIPQVSADVEDLGDVGLPPAPTIFGVFRGWRTTHQTPEVRRPARSLGTTPLERASTHADHGQPDARRIDGAPALGEDRDPAQRVNTLTPVDLDPIAAPDRPRAGWTGRDPVTRPAKTRRAFVFAPFDKWAAEHPGAVDKIPLIAPKAATPREVPALADGRPSAAGSAASSLLATAAPAPRLSFRAQARPWYEGAQLTPPPTPGQTAAQADAGRGRMFR